MNEKTPEPPDNVPLRTMITAGVLFALLGSIVWLGNTDFSAGSYPAQHNRTGQAIGSAILRFGLLLLALGWAAVAIARAIEIGKR